LKYGSTVPPLKLKDPQLTDLSLNIKENSASECTLVLKKGSEVSPLKIKDLW